MHGRKPIDKPGDARDLVGSIRGGIPLEPQQHDDGFGREDCQGHLDLAGVCAPGPKQHAAGRAVSHGLEQTKVRQIRGVEFHCRSPDALGHLQALRTEDVQLQLDTELSGVGRQALPDGVVHLERLEQVVVLVVGCRQFIGVHQLVLRGVCSGRGGRLHQEARLLRAPFEPLGKFGDDFNVRHQQSHVPPRSGEGAPPGGIQQIGIACRKPFRDRRRGTVGCREDSLRAAPGCQSRRRLG